MYALDAFLLIVIVCNRRGSFLSTTIFVYALSSPINGYFGGSLYSRMGGMLYIVFITFFITIISN